MSEPPRAPRSREPSPRCDPPLPSAGERRLDNDLKPSKNGDGGKVLEISVALDPTAPRASLWRGAVTRKRQPSAPTRPSIRRSGLAIRQQAEVAEEQHVFFDGALALGYHRDHSDREEVTRATL